jgi:cytochrome d ubiquinol oxidase subunit II
VPFGFDDFMVSTYTGTFWQLLNPFALLAGVVSSAMITMHGGMYLAHRTEGDIQQRAARAAVGAALVMVLAFVGAGLWLKFGGIEGFVITSALDPAAMPDPLNKTVARSVDGWWLNYARQPLTWLLPALGIAGAVLAAGLVTVRRTLSAFVASALAIVGVIGTAGAAMFPFIMPSSSMPNASLTVWDSVSSRMTLGLMLGATLVFMPLIVFYTSWAYRVMRGKVTVAHIRANEHNAY